MQPARRSRVETPLSLLVVVGLTVGALVGAWWSVTHEPSRPGVAADGGPSAGDWTDVGWDVAADRPWLASLVRITADRCGQDVVGTGVVVGDAVLTNRHVVDGASTITLTTADGSTIPGRIVSVNSEVDLARVEAADLPPGLSLAPPSGDGSDTTLAGFPGGRDLAVRAASVSAAQRGWGYPDPDRPLRLDVDVVPGDSGSPLVDADGRVAGLVYARSDDGGAGLVIGAGELGTLIDELVPGPGPVC